MARIILTGLLVFAVTACTVQGASTNIDASSVQEEIDRTLWQPFRAAFEQLDGAALNALYADQVLRVTPAGIDTSGQFKVFNRSRFVENLANGDRVKLDFWFDSRHTNHAVSYEVGFYRLTVVAPDGAVNGFYGQFHIVLQRIGGSWKIVQDWDTDTVGGQPLGAADFARHPPVDF